MELGYKIKQVKPVKINGLRCNLSPTGKGHVGIVTAVDKNGNFKLAHARGVKKLSMENPAYTTPEVYRPGAEFYGFYRPTNETPDGKDINSTNNASNTNNTNTTNNTGTIVPDNRQFYFEQGKPATLKEKVGDFIQNVRDFLREPVISF